MDIVPIKGSCRLRKKLSRKKTVRRRGKLVRRIEGVKGVGGNAWLEDQRKEAVSKHKH